MAIESVFDVFFCIEDVDNSIDLVGVCAGEGD
jgi:hypothetical protein